MDCFLVVRGIKTLPIRMDRHAENARRVSEYLETRTDVEKALYPGLPSQPQHALAKAQMRSGGGMVSFVPRGGAQAARRVAESTRLFSLAESLGGDESLIEVAAAMTHASVQGTQTAVDPALVRLSEGLEAAPDLIVDLASALDRAQ